MVIGFDGSRAFQQQPTGTENYSYQLLKALAKIDHKNTYIAYLRSKQTSAIAQVIDIFPKNFLFKQIPWPRFWTQAGLSIQTFKDKLDILFVPAHTLPLVRRPSLKTVITVHDLGVSYLPSMHQFKQRLYLSWVQKFQLKTATAIIAVSKATKNDLVKKVGLDAGKIKVVYEGYDKNIFRPMSGDILVNGLKKFRLKPGGYFLFVSTVQPRKNLERLILAFHKSLIINHKSLQLVIAGCKGWMSDDIYELPKKLGLEDRVKFLGYVAEKDLPALYSGAIALTFPSLFEGFGLPILEAQACGCLVLTSNVSSMPEVGRKAAIYVNPYNIDDLVKGMEKFNNQDTRNKIIKAGFENVKRFSWEKCARETLEVFENL